MSHEEEIEGQEYNVDYSYIDLRPMNYQKKIETFLKQDKNHPLIPRYVSRTEI